MADARPANVGILAMEVYFPKTYVAQRDLELFDGVPSGKYTLGLGQDAMSFTGDREDVNSIALTVVAQLLEKYGIRADEIGRLEVGTESLVDKSKSTKTVLMQLFEPSGNTSIEGVSTINACYGATAALFNALAWVESSAWDGRLAIVVATDIAVYAKGPARPTGGCGAAAMLIGPNAPLVVDARARGTFSSHIWDFYKPDPSVEFPTVDGRLSQTCYLRALDACYQLFCDKSKADTRLTDSDFAVFHSPYNKLVQRSVARLFFLDYRRQGLGADPASKLSRWSDVPLEKTYTDRELDLASREACGDLYAKMAQPCYTVAKQIGNAYTASIYINLATLVASQGAALSGKRALMFSYGSGCMSTMFAIHARDATNPRFSLTAMAEKLQITERLKERVGVSAAEYEQFMDQRERFHGQHSVTPAQSVEWLFDGAYYLEAIDAQFRRTYARKTRETVETIVNGTAAAVAESSAACAYVSGVSALLPGRHHAGDHSPLDALLRGDNCIERLRGEAVDAMLERNIVQLKRSSPGHVERLRVASRSDSIQLAALAPSVDLTAAPYHLPPSMVDAMDEPTQLGVAAGLNAMRDAGLVGTQNVHVTASDWQLAPALASSTGVIYASSFPTMHATAAEIARFHDAPSAYELDRKLLFRLLVLANAQLAQITGARGPNTQINAACAGMTQAIAMARDWLTLRKCDRVVVVASDVASSETLLPLIGSGFRVLGAASTAATVEQAARPFDAQRNGMIVGSGAAALVLEAPAQGPIGSAVRGPRVVRLLAARYANSAFHGASIAVEHVTQELRALFEEMETVHGITRAQFVAHGVYYSHETFTNASPTSSCAFAEVSALRGALGDDALVEQLLITNTKGFTAHAMGVSFEDVAAVEGLRRGVVPPVVHFQTHDPHLGVKLRLARGGAHPHKYALRFAAGFGSQVALTLYALEVK